MQRRTLIIAAVAAVVVLLVVAGVVIATRNRAPSAGTGPSSAPPASTSASPSTSPSGSTTPTPPADQPVPTTFPAQQRRPFRPPIELKSTNGQLRTTFTAEPTTFDVAGTPVKGYAYRGEFIGPTLRVRPGDTVRFDLINRLGAPTNLHGHGMFMSPIGIGDNVLRVMKNGSFNHVEWKLPTDIDPGTYWYHSHLHGLVEKQVFSGLSGVLIVDGLEARLPAALRGVKQHVVALKDLQVKDGAIANENINSDAPTTRTVNGEVDPLLKVRTNETQMLRLANIGADIWYRLKLSGARFHVIAQDANPMARVETTDELVLPPGKRFDVLVRWPHAGTQTLTTLPYSTGPDGDNYPERRLMTFDVAGDAVSDVAWPTSLGPVSPLVTNSIDRHRTLVFSENTKTNQFFINGRQFDPTHVNIVAKLGTTEEWTIRNVSGEEHPFHIHVNDFVVTEVNGRKTGNTSEQDTVPLPVHGEVKIRMQFNRYVGAYVFHCHILAHEDNGMMGIIDVTRNGQPSPATQRALDEMNRQLKGQPGMDMAMPMGHQH